MKKIKRLLKPGEKIVLPNTDGIAVIAEIVSDTIKDYLIDAGGLQQFVSKETVKYHALLLDTTQAKAYITQRIEDPENKIVFLRFVYADTIIDRLYNWYNARLKRPDKSIIDAVK